MPFKFITLLVILTAWVAAFSYEASCVTGDEDTGLLWLVNRDNPLPSDFRPADLVKFQGAELRACARDAFIDMLAAMESENIRGLRLQSAYRSHSYQSAIFEQRIKELVAKGNNRSAASAIAVQSIQKPGASEHQLGLALDVSVNGKLSQSFAETDAGRWLAENCYKFGFIIRYPQHKTEVTNIMFEPWHLRYVGIPHAQIIKETARTLEEYHDFLVQNPMYVVWKEDFYFLVMYSPSPPEVADSEIISISATYRGESAGYIITVKRSSNFEELKSAMP